MRESKKLVTKLFLRLWWDAFKHHIAIAAWLTWVTIKGLWAVYISDRV